MGKVTRFAGSVAIAALLAGCATFGAPPVQNQLTFCKGAKPISPEKGETAKLSDKLFDQLDQHNRLGAKACGWKP